MIRVEHRKRGRRLRAAPGCARGTRPAVRPCLLLAVSGVCATIMATMPVWRARDRARRRATGAPLLAGPSHFDLRRTPVGAPLLAAGLSGLEGLCLRFTGLPCLHCTRRTCRFRSLVPFRPNLGPPHTLRCGGSLGYRVRTPMLRSTHAQNCPCVTHPRTLTLSAPRTPPELSTAASTWGRRRVPDGDGVRPVAALRRLRSPSCKCSSKEASPVSTRSPSGPGRSTRSSSSIKCHQPLTRGSCLGRVDAMRLL